MRFAISSKHDGPCHRVRVSGEIDIAAGPDLRKALDAGLDADDTASLIVDLDEVTFLDCAGISALVYGRLLARNHGLSYAIHNAHGMPALLLRLTGVEG